MTSLRLAAASLLALARSQVQIQAPAEALAPGWDRDAANNGEWGETAFGSVSSLKQKL
jgi:hypothetical protein